ncbi:cytochrome c biogenesis CcdA family protein [Paraburkholderia sp. SOS3]|jgi:cytochrome c-type biogenesis protein|uniref:cytochrome c biogenesis CcdA family protein n=1 Tax=Paraburkholderia sp. SOS3 TaxID=1926494 RepID=UPI0009475D80|nr:cytochrome c biogenesis CcdA family protein [Paraburkholderia sp. SOS3]APR39896.1 cytochrome C biogenesis protein [Paraburkholderia sp. SOS3]
MSASFNLLLLGYAAGALTILSPCVLPLVPIVLGSAAQRSRWGPLALAAGLVASFTLVALAVALAGVSSGSDVLRIGGAAVLVLAGVAMLFKRASAGLGRLLAPLTAWASDTQLRAERFGTLGQAAIGVLLGVVWSPCIGPTLGAATALASQGRDVGSATLTIFSFGAGIATMLLVVALAARTLLPRWRQRLMSVGGIGNRVFGALLVVVGLLIITGLDRQFEALAVAASPDWLTDLTTRF